MKTKILTTVLLFGVSLTGAQASLLTLNNASPTHTDINGNQIETYFFTANANVTDARILVQSSDLVTPNGTLNMDGFLSVWQQVGNNWSLLAFNNDAPRPGNQGPVSIYGQTTLGFINNPNTQTSGFTDPGIQLNLSSGSNYLVIQSEAGNEPGAIGQQLLGLSSDPLTALSQQGIDQGGPYVFNYSLSVTDNSGLFNANVNITQTSAPAAVPIPAAIWLFGSVVAGFVGIGRKKNATI
jgi:hypothetical protein